MSDLTPGCAHNQGSSSVSNLTPACADGAGVVVAVTTAKEEQPREVREFAAAKVVRRST